MCERFSRVLFRHWYRSFFIARFRSRFTLSPFANQRSVIEFIYYIYFLFFSHSKLQSFEWFACEFEFRCALSLWVLSNCWLGLGFINFIFSSLCAVIMLLYRAITTNWWFGIEFWVSRNSQFCLKMKMLIECSQWHAMYVVYFYIISIMGRTCPVLFNWFLIINYIIKK